MGRFETEVLTTPDNLAALADMSVWSARSARPHGDQEGTAWNGHFGCTCYHPLFLFNQHGHLERRKLRLGNVHSADRWKDDMKPVMARYGGRDVLRFFRADAAFALPALYTILEAEGNFFAIRLPTNAVLQEKIAHLLKCRSAGYRTTFGGSTTTSTIKQVPGTSRPGYWPRSNGIRANCSLARVSSSPTSPWSPSTSSASTNSMARQDGAEMDAPVMQ